jgi:hypothetical protein
MQFDMVLEIGFMEKILAQQVRIILLVQKIIYGDDHEMLMVIIMIMVIKNILDNDRVQRGIMYQVSENGVN